jgi:hypothetical protein
LALFGPPEKVLDVFHLFHPKGVFGKKKPNPYGTMARRAAMELCKGIERMEDGVHGVQGMSEDIDE